MTALLTNTAAQRSRRSMERCGGKAANLYALRSAGFPVPDFVVSPTCLTEALEELGWPVVVRSSATCEDGTDTSFAGQFQSFLGLNRLSDVEDAVQKCHQSLHQPSVIEYCRRHGIRSESIKMEVIIQRMVQPQLAGVAFTVNPSTGNEEVVIEACEGLADNLVAGREASLSADHPLVAVHGPEIERLARQVQRYFGSPQDIEFAVEAGEIYVLQSRPITRLGFCGQVGQWTNADFRDGGVSSAVCSPLMGSLYERVWDQSLKDTLRELRLFCVDFEASRMFFGRPYWNLGAVKDSLSQLPGYNERAFDNDLSVKINYEGDGRTTPVTPLGLLRAAPKVFAFKRFLDAQQRDAAHLLGLDVEQRLRAFSSIQGDLALAFEALLEREYFGIERTYFRTIFAASLAKLDFVEAFPGADYGSLVAGLPSLRHFEPVRAVQTMEDRSDRAITDVINRFPHHYCRGLDIIHPRWDEDREFVQGLLSTMPATNCGDASAVYQQAMASALGSLPRWKHARFHRKLALLRHYLWLREELRDVSNRVYHLIRRHVLAIADRRGLGESIFFQTYQEILRDDRSNIDRNREVYESYRNFQAPNEIGGDSPTEENSTSSDMRGIAASPGTIVAPAFVALSVEEASRMPRGHILICRYTDPGWTAVLDRVGGVVTETGGLLSHAAIICREFGVPAVLGVEGATHRIPHGTAVEIHGGEGKIRLALTSEGD